MNEDQIREAATAVKQVVGFSAYLHGIDYDVEHFREELGRMAEFVAQQQKGEQRAA